MKNALNYYYNLYPTSIHQINDSYRCYIQSEEYLLMPYQDDFKYINQIYELSNYLLQINVPCHKIIKNINGQILTLINNTNYLLIQILVKNKNLNIDDILYFSAIYVDRKYFNELAKDDWYKMWTQKIDYFEYQVSQFGLRYPIIRESINYYIGMAENSISLFTNIGGLHRSNSNLLYVCHKRIKSHDGYFDLYNPLNFILDNKVRNLSEYIKSKFFFSKYTIDDAKGDISKFNLNIFQCNMLFVRLLFPSYYFDCYEQVMEEKKKEIELVKIISKNKSYTNFLKELYIFIKPFSDLPDIEWIIKT